MKSSRPKVTIAVVALCTLTSGCFVLTSEWRSKPEVHSKAVEVQEGSERNTYAGTIETRDLKLQVIVENGPVRWEAPFFLYILPIPTSYSYLATQPLRVDLFLQPRVGQLVFDPWQTFFSGTNRVRVAPAHIWQGQKSLQTSISKASPLTTNTSFVLEFTPWDQTPPDRALPFQLSIEGLKASSQSIPVPAITFQPRTHIRAGFQLPY